MPHLPAGRILETGPSYVKLPAVGKEPEHDEEGNLASDFAGGDAAAGTSRARTAEALREELELERRQRLKDVRRERKERLEA